MNERERFEEWFSEKGFGHSLERSSGAYSEKITRFAWYVFQAGRADAMAQVQAAFEAEIQRVSHVEYDSQVICRHFFEQLQKRLKGSA